ncbi:MAG: ATP-dependent DNA helicase RecG [Candidatus Cloacimonadaceae bacterium]
MGKEQQSEVKTPVLLTPVKYLKGIGEVRARQLAKLDVKTILDLMELYPRAYIQRSLNVPIAEFKVGQQVAFIATISWVDKRITRKNQIQINVGVTDGVSSLVCTWFNLYPGQEEQFKPGNLAWFSGTVSEFQNTLQIIHPEFELLDEESEPDFWKKRLVLPVYPLSGKLTQNLMRKAVLQAFSQYASQVEENLPSYLVAKYHFTPRKDALEMMHFTTHPEKAEEVRRRFAYEDFFYQQLMWARHHQFHENEVRGIAFINKKQLTRRLYDTLPFKLTSAQKRVLREIFADMTSPRQMSRLLQGDVGSGKTIVTLLAMLLAIENGYQTALMAPTEILAEQHYANLSRFLTGFSEVKICLLKGGQFKGKTELKEQIASGEINLVVGTHALLQEDVKFKALGFAAVDEQHRFGVEQRAKLAKHSTHPDLLYLSATPIPRSLAMTVYGDLEVSVLDELPPNRKPVSTFVRNSAKRDLVYSEIRKELQKGRQAYIVCPLIEESEKSDLLSAETLFKYIRDKVFPEYKVELLHGRMKNADKEAIMHAFQKGEIQILVSTTVIEVGVDIPNATVMVVEHAERFGLAQLHQLRGRVGRGAEQSFCYLIEHFPVSHEAGERLSTMTGTNDGFVIAEKDLELRGPGEFFGTEQSGMPRFRFADIIRDQHLLKLARNDAFDLIQKDFGFTLPEHCMVKKHFEHLYAQREKLILY